MTDAPTRTSDKAANKKGVFGYTALHQAVADGNSKKLGKLLAASSEHVNCRANSGYTPLHLAAGSGHGECVKILLNHGADMTLLDEYSKTPKQTAELSSKRNIVRLLQSEEIIKEVKDDGEHLTELLRQAGNLLEPDCLNRALIAATENDNHYNIGKLMVKGATNLDECLKIAKKEQKPHARAMMLLIKAAKTGNKDIIQKLYRETSVGSQNPDDGFADVQKGVLTGKVSTVVPIEIARRNGQAAVREELLLKTDVNQEEGYVYWHGLRLLNLDISWLRKIYWVKKLKLARNGFKSLPPEMGAHLKQVVKIDLQHNDLQTIPRCLLELPSLGELNLSHNKLKEIPDVLEWSVCLTVLDLSFNQLSSMPLNAVAPGLKSLNLSNNSFSTVPLCICSFTALNNLNLADNPEITSLPPEMGRLSSLTRLNLTNLKDLNDPPKNLQDNPRHCIIYLNSKRRYAKGFYKMKLMLVGSANRGKTTLVARLQGKDCGNESTVGVDVSEWLLKPTLGRKQFQFSIWDFGGQEEYYATHQCFLSQNSLYLILFNLTHGSKGVEEIKPWLNNIAMRAPQSCVIIVGTHLDQFKDDNRDKVEAILRKVATMAESYKNKLQIKEVLSVGLKDCIENVGSLKEAIYEHAAEYKPVKGEQPIMGQKIPASYHALDKQLETVQAEVRCGVREPIMHAEEFKTMVKEMSLMDIQDDDELKTAALFLTDVGSLLHFDDRSHNLHELYFVDPRWLCDMMSKVVTIKERNPFVKKGILHSKDIPLLFKDDQFPWRYFEQYFTVLDRFEIAIPLDNKRVLIPSMLPEQRPKDLPDEDHKKKEPVYTRFITFYSDTTPPGFWSRLLSRIMHSVPQVRFVLDKITPSNLKQDTQAVNRSSASLSVGSQASEEIVHTMGDDTIPTNDANMETNTSNEGTNEEGNINSNVSPSSQISDANPLPASSSGEQQTSSLTNGPSLSSGSRSTSKLAPRISGPLTQSMENAPNIIPNFPESLHFAVDMPYDVDEIQLEYWRTGLHYHDPGIMFRIESLSQNKKFRLQNKEGVLIVTSPNAVGKKIVGQLVDLAVSLVNEWYPGLKESPHSSAGLEQKIPCLECAKEGRARPFEFGVEDCLTAITKDETSIKCGYIKDDPDKNHTVPLIDVVPDLLLQDIEDEFLLQAEDIIYQEDNASLLGKGGYGIVFKGKCKGKSVAIKKYLTKSGEAFSELRSESKLLQLSHHPCLVCLVGVCIHPIMALVLELAPLKALDYPILKKKLPVPRLTIFRIVAEIAAALRFLHSKSVIFRDLKAANVLLWTLDPDSLCHCKLTDFGISTYLAPVGARGVTGTKGFIAPEVLHIGKRKQHSVYGPKADIFSYAMLLYQLIARRHPYHDILPHRVDHAIESKERPKLKDVLVARNGYHYLTRLMKKCWEDNPKHRPDTGEIIKTVCLSAMQSVMCVTPVKSKHSLRQAISITPTDFSRADIPERLHSELWVVCGSPEGTEINAYNSHTMGKIVKNFIKDNHVQCIALCEDHVWVGSRHGIEYDMIDIFSISNRDLVHNIRLTRNSVSCIASVEGFVYLGTLEGYCFSFVSDIDTVRANFQPKYKRVSKEAIDSITTTQHCIWVSHTRYISFLNFDDLSVEGSIHRNNVEDANIGQLSSTADESIVWSAHHGGTLLTAWDALQKAHCYDVNTAEHLKQVCSDAKEKDMVITAMTPALDCVWVGMASGHIMVFHEQDFLVCYQPYKEYVRFLTCIPASGPCEMEKSVVASGGKNFQPLIEGMEQDYKEVDDKGIQLDKAGVVVMWEAYDSKTMQQIKLIEKEAPELFDNHHTVRSMIQKGEFKDGTHMRSDTSTEASTYTRDLEAQPDLEVSYSESFGEPDAGNLGGEREMDISFSESVTESESLAESLAMGNRNTSILSTSSQQNNSHSIPFNDTESQTRNLNRVRADTDIQLENPQLIRPRSRTTAVIIAEVFNVKLPPSKPNASSNQKVRVRCPKPATLEELLCELEVNAGIKLEDYQLEYCVSEDINVRINDQDDLEKYLLLKKKPELMLTPRK